MTADSGPVVWIINHYSTIPSRDGAGARHFRLAQELVRNGWRPLLILASTTHPAGAQHLGRGERRRRGVEEGVPFLMVRTPRYRGGLQRVWNMAVFAVRLLLPGTVRGVPTPDVVVGSTVHLLASWAALRLARRYRVPFVFEIRDIWPETLIDLGKLQAGSLAARLMSRVSRHLASQASLVVSPLPGVRSYLDGMGLGDTPFHWASNGVDLPQQSDARYPAVRDEFVIMYLGSHGNANGLEGLLDAFDEAAGRPDRTQKLRLRLVGDGTQKETLRIRAAALKSAELIEFEDRIPRSEVIDRAREADALIVNLEDLPVYRFGISLNKLYDYLVAERPIIIATSAVNNPVADAGAGLTVPAGDSTALATAIREMSELPQEVRAEMGRRGATHVETQYTYAAIGDHLAIALGRIRDDARRD